MTLAEYKHHSPSSVTSFLEYRPEWYLHKYLGKRAPTTESMLRGTCVEDGINTFVQQWDWEFPGSKEDKDDLARHCAEASRRRFIKECDDFGLLPECYESEQIPGAVCESIDAILGLGPRSIKTQVKAMSAFDGLHLPILGYLDYLIEMDDGSLLIRDKKTSSKTPSKLSHTYTRQGAFYAHAIREAFPGKHVSVDFDFSVLLKSGLKRKLLDLSEAEQRLGLAELVHSAKQIENIVMFFSTHPDDILESLMFPNIGGLFNPASIDFMKDAFKLEY